MEKSNFNKENVLSCIEFATAELQSVNNEMTRKQLAEVITEATNFLSEAQDELDGIKWD